MNAGSDLDPLPGLCDSDVCNARFREMQYNLKIYSARIKDLTKKMTYRADKVRFSLASLEC